MANGEIERLKTENAELKQRLRKLEAQLRERDGFVRLAKHERQDVVPKEWAEGASRVELAEKHGVAVATIAKDLDRLWDKLGDDGYFSLKLSRYKACMRKHSFDDYYVFSKEEMLQLPSDVFISYVGRCGKSGLQFLAEINVGTWRKLPSKVQAEFGDRRRAERRRMVTAAKCRMTKRRNWRRKRLSRCLNEARNACLSHAS